MAVGLSCLKQDYSRDLECPFPYSRLEWDRLNLYYFTSIHCPRHTLDYKQLMGLVVDNSIPAWSLFQTNYDWRAIGIFFEHYQWYYIFYISANLQIFVSFNTDVNIINSQRDNFHLKNLLINIIHDWIDIMGTNSNPFDLLLINLIDKQHI
jgi:hypothetical protein